MYDGARLGSGKATRLYDQGREGKGRGGVTDWLGRLLDVHVASQLAFHV
jgi:hypothetical protein